VSINWSDGTFSDCVFDGNATIASGPGGAVYTSGPRDVSFTQCEFSHNDGSEGGAIYVNSVVTLTVTRCLLKGNMARRWGGALATNSGAGQMLFDQCTFVANASGGASIHVGAPITLNRCVLAGAVSAASLICWGPNAVLNVSCTDIIGNQNGDWVDCLASWLGTSSNFSADALFCDSANGDFRLQSDSPCAPANSGGCGLIGALDVGCGPVSLTPETWARIKAAYRLTPVLERPAADQR
jgi:hypothetical protein